jgi:hypothetical protein
VIPGAYFGDGELLADDPEGQISALRLGLLFCRDDLVYALVRFPDVPFHECAGGYCGKRGLLHTAAEYHEFLVWQCLLLIGWVVCIGWWLLLRVRTYLQGHFSN